ncbi:hypothetical protein [Burkholderia cepacia]|uniref:hypothetical protein n=1 Tax=Burkholderia cepacia TaxID=292 RepID=UPI00158B558B|nr:hypothetical protein [Burkholderia cepacia]
MKEINLVFDEKLDDSLRIRLSSSFKEEMKQFAKEENKSVADITRALWESLLSSKKEVVLQK